MNFEDFVETLRRDEPPAALAPALRALWLDAKGDWDGAHQIAQDMKSEAGARIHAYLHRKEGDLSNARYWYGEAQVPVANGSLDEEWEEIVKASL
jgi:hypothetical protein